MENTYKKGILRNWSELVEKYDLKEIFRDVSDKDSAFKKIMEKANLDDSNKQHVNRTLLFELMEFNSTNMYLKFIHRLRKHDHTEIANKIENKFDIKASDQKPPHKTSCFQPAVESGSLEQLPLNVFLTDVNPLMIHVKIPENFCDTLQDSLRNKLDCYRTRSKNRGHVLIINNIEFKDQERHPFRNGADVDEQNLTKLFTLMGLQVEAYKNQSLSAMKETIIKFCRYDISDEEPDVCLVIIMSHGERFNNETYIVSVDGEYLAEQWVIGQFSNNSCALFQDKPKILIFHVCRGDLMDDVVLKRTEMDGIQSKAPELESDKDHRYYSDMMICHPSVEGFRAHRDPFKGCWYIEVFCKVFMEHAHETDVESMLKLVDKELSFKMSETLSRQTSTYTNVGFRTCFLNPGIYEDCGKLARINPI